MTAIEHVAGRPLQRVAQAVLPACEWAGWLAIVIVYSQFPDRLRLFDADSLIALAALGVGLRARIRRTIPSPLPALAAVLGLYLAVCLASTYWAAGQARAATAMTRLVKDAALFLILTGLLAAPIPWRRGAWAVVVAGLGTTCVPVYQWATGSYQHDFSGFGRFAVMHLWGDVDGFRATGTLSDPNYYAQSLLPVFAIAFALFWSTRGLVLRVVAALAAQLALAGIALSYSRGGMVGLGVVVAASLATVRPMKRALLAMALLLALAVPFVSTEYVKRATTLGRAAAPTAAPFVTEPGFRGRASEALAALHMFRDHPWSGVGLGNYPFHYQRYAARFGLEHRREDREAHSLPLEIAAETGLPGLVAFSLLLLAILRQPWRVWRARASIDRDHLVLTVGIVVGLAGYLTTSLFLHDAYMRQLWTILALASASAHDGHRA